MFRTLVSRAFVILQCVPKSDRGAKPPTRSACSQKKTSGTLRLTLLTSSRRGSDLISTSAHLRLNKCERVSDTTFETRAGNLTWTCLLRRD